MAAFPPAARARRAGLAGALCAALAVSLAACSGDDPDAGTNGVGKLSAKEIETRARTAADAAKAVRVAGTLIGKGGSYQLNMRLTTDGGTGSVTSKSSTFGLLRIGDVLYVKAGAGFWKQTDGKDGAAAAGKLDDKYVKVPKQDPAYGQFRGFTDMHALLDGLLGLHGSLGKGDRTKVGGVPAVQVTGGGGQGGTLDVSLKGTPYPLRFERAGGAGALRLTEWNRSVTLKAPGKDDTVDHGHELPTS
ncbi:hypothetical protein OG372_24585 [Streptomyces sp. NBC_01020]|uniref:hypothetical protein n=1 Tax=Streptomyces sp. NBC_01020 TaxID=2903722 RepID=UPI003868AEFB|nr:hypothetical protein OG372_24585 [Streptomyces sp. NBC_01020]